MAVDLAPWKVKPDPDLLAKIEAMAEELARQSANLAAAEYRWLRLLGEFDAIGGWAYGGAKTCAAWLSWACGLSLPAAREKARVATALPDLPVVCASFAAGRLSYSKVRAITRVATPANEQVLVDYGESATAAQLETVLRGYRRTQRLDDAREAAGTFERRSVRWWVDEEGFVCLSARLAPDDGALVVAELERLAESGGEVEAAPPAPPTGRVLTETAEKGRGDAPVVSDRFTASEPAAARRADALRMMAETAAAHGPTACVGGDTHLVIVQTTDDELRDEPGDDVPADPEVAVGSSIEGVGRVSAETARRIACDASVVSLVEDAGGRPLGVGRQSKKVPRWLRRAVKRRDRGCCRFPGCPAQRFLDAHHIRHWADGGPTDLDNLLLLCRFHHRLVHEVGYRIRTDATDRFTFLRADGVAVSAAPPHVVGDGHAVEHDNLASGLHIDHLTGIPDWDGAPPDYSHAIEHLCFVSAEAPTDEDDASG